MMKNSKFQKIWLSIRRSDWYLAILAVIPNLIISFAWSYGKIMGFVGFITSFIAIEGLIIVLTILMRPLLQAEKVFDKVNLIEVDTPEGKIMLSRIKAKVPPSNFIGEWIELFPKLKDSCRNLTQVTEDTLCLENITVRNMNTVIDTYNLASAQIKGERTFDIDSLKNSSSFLGRHEAREVTKVLVINRIDPVFWFTPEMVIYLLDLYRNYQDHPNKPKFVRIHICENDDVTRINNLCWAIQPEVDPLKAFIAINQIAEIELMSLERSRFDNELDQFISENIKRIRDVYGEISDDTIKYIKDVAFIMYCKGDEPIKAFRGRPYSSTLSYTQQSETTMWPEIMNQNELPIYRDLFYSLVAISNPIPVVNLSKIC